MKKALIISAILVLAFSSMMFASEARILSLGLGNTPWMTQDVTLVNLYPAQLVNYGNIADLELTAAGVGGGATFNLGGNVLGIENTPFNDNLFTNTLLNNVAGTNLIGLLPNLRQTTLGYGMNMGGMNGAIGLSYGTQAANTSAPAIANVAGKATLDDSIQTIGILLGLGIPSDSPLDFGLSINLPGGNYLDQTYGATGLETLNNTETMGGVEVGFNGRLGMGSMLANLGINFTSLNDTMDTRTYAGGAEATDQQQVTNESGFGINLGAAQTVKPSENTDVIIGGVLNFDTYNLSNKTTNKMGALALPAQFTDSGSVFKLPIYVAAEAKVNSTFTLRGGLSSPVYENGSEQDKTETGAGVETGDTTYNDSGNNNGGLVAQLSAADAPEIAIGAGMKISDFNLDADIADQFLLNGPYFFTGRATAGFAGQVALTYNWK
jgi:hypothetical protein